MNGWHPENMHVHRFYTVTYKSSQMNETFRGRYLGLVELDRKLYLRFETIKNATRTCEIPIREIIKVEE